MKRSAVLLVFVTLGCSSDPGGGVPSDPCELVPEFTCRELDGSTCDEVYTDSAREDLAMYCDDLEYQVPSTSGDKCPRSMECCFYAEGGYGDGAQVHCVDPGISSDYRGYCVRNGGTFCER